MKSKALLNRLQKSELKLEKIVLLTVSLFVFFTMYYYDNQTAFLRIQENMHRIVIEGKWYYFFNGWFAIPYGILLQMVCAVWSLPVFILSEMGVISASCVGARLWYKTFIIVFLVLDTWQLGKMAEKMGISGQKKEWVKLFFLSSLLVMLPAVHIAQFDAIYLFFILLGINCYMEDEHYKFLLCFMLAIPGKYIPLFVFIPLVLLKEKRYIFIARDLAFGCALVLVDRVMNSIGYRIENYLGIDPSQEIYNNVTLQEDFEGLLHSDFKAFDSQMSIIVLCFALLCIWCFMKKSELSNKLAVFVSFLGFAMLFAFGCATPYWIIVQIPFSLLLIFKSNKHYNILFPLEMIFTLGYIFVYIIKIPWIFGAENTFSFLLFSLIPGYTDGIHGFMSDFIKLRGLELYDGAMAAAMVACLVGITIITYPLKQTDTQEMSEDQNYMKNWYWGRMIVAIGWILLNVWVVFLNHMW